MNLEPRLKTGEGLADHGLESERASGKHCQSVNSPLLMFVVPLPQPHKDNDMPDFDNLIYEKPEAGITRIWLNRPEARNAQDAHLLYELNDAFDIAMGDS